MLDSEKTTTSSTPISVVHSCHVWLSQTMTWLYTQVMRQPEHIKNHVVTDLTQNLDQFPFQNLTCEADDYKIWQWLSRHSWRIRRWRQTRLLINKIHSTGATVLHSHFGPQGWRNLDIAAKTRINHVVTFYGYDASRQPKSEPEWQARYRDLFNQADLFLCEGPHLGKCLIELGCPESKVMVHHLGINLDRIPYRPTPWQPGETLRVLMAGTFVEKKGMPLAIKALGEVQKRFPLELTIIGDAVQQPRSQEEKQRILNALDQHGLTSCTRLLGYQPHSTMMEEAYRNHIFLSPSVTASDGDTEGGAPVSIIEMAAAGLLVVSSTHCDIPEVIVDEHGGALAEEGNQEDLTKKLLHLLESSDNWQTMTAVARKHIEKEFDAATQGSRLGHIYESL